MSKKIRTRFAPSPTGMMHIGNFRTALYTFLIARHAGGTFILRIEDTDQQRYVEGAMETIFRNLRWAGIDWDEGVEKGGEFGPYIQSERKAIYKKYAEELIKKGHAYYCFCSKERLEEMRREQEAEHEAPRYDRHCRHLSPKEVEKRLANNEPCVIRQAVPDEGEASFDDLVFGKIAVNVRELEDQILMKSDGLPTYNFANVVDDHLMEISHIIRGSEYLSSTPKYNLLYEAFGWEKPSYVHLPVLTDEQHKKLSKRSGDVAMDEFIVKGYTKEAIVNYVALLGWNPGTEKEIFTMDELIKEFSVEKIHKSPAVFDYKKLNWLNGQYLRKMPFENFYEFIKPFYPEDFPKSLNFGKISKILHARVEVPADIPGMIDFLQELPDYDIYLHTHKKMKTDSEIALRVLHRTLKVFTELEEWNEENIKASLFKECEDMGLKTGQVMWPVRVALTGKEFTPGGAIEIADILGKEESLRRIKKGIEKLQK